jgi:response regulator of citrate/malate metabolism
MAERGKPLPFAMKQEIQAKRREATVRQLASELNLSKTTVQKYGSNRLVQNRSQGARNLQ